MLHTKLYFFIETLLLLVFPIYLTVVSPAFLENRHFVMAFGLLYILFLTRHLIFPKIFPLFRFPSLKSLFFYTLMPSVFVIGIMWLLYGIEPRLIIDPDKIVTLSVLPWFAPLILYPLLSVPLQEIIFRWFYMNRISAVFSSQKAIVLIAAILFGFAHISMGPTTLIGTFILGLWWGMLYLKTKNLWPTMIAHSMVGNFLIWLTLVQP